MNSSAIGFAKSGCRLQRAYRAPPAVEGRSADNLEHVGGGGLLLQRFAQFAEQPHILDGDDGLGGKVFDQLDLLFGERLDTRLR